MRTVTVVVALAILVWGPFASAQDSPNLLRNDEITGFNIPTGIPIAYDLDDDLKPRSREFLGDPEAVAKAAAAVAAQGKAKG